MRSRTWKLAVVVLALVTVGVGVQLKTEANGPYDVTNCRIPCEPVTYVYAGHGGYYICVYNGTCTNGTIGQSCNYQCVFHG